MTCDSSRIEDNTPQMTCDSSRIENNTTQMGCASTRTNMERRTSHLAAVKGF